MTNSLKMYQNTNRSSAKKMVRIAGQQRSERNGENIQRSSRRSG